MNKSVNCSNGEADKNKVVLDTVLTDELKEGLLREVVRTINQIQRSKLTIADRVMVKYSTDDALLNPCLLILPTLLKSSFGVLWKKRYGQ